MSPYHLARVYVGVRGNEKALAALEAASQAIEFDYRPQGGKHLGRAA